MKGKKGRGGHSSKGEGRCKTRGGKEMAEGGRGELVRERREREGEAREMVLLPLLALSLRLLARGRA